MKFLDLKGLKHLLGKLVKYDSGTSNVSNIYNLNVDNRIGAVAIQGGDPTNITNRNINFSVPNTLFFQAGSVEFKVLGDTKYKQDLYLISMPLLEKVFPEEFQTIKSQGLFYTIADILHTLKDKGIMQ